VEGRPREDDSLVERAMRGDAEAYEELVRLHQGIAFRTALLVCGNAADAEESAQDGFVKAYRALGRFRRGAPFRPWLLAIVANEARNRRRSAGRRGALDVRLAAEGPGDAAPSPETSAAAGERRAELLAAIHTLREEEQQILACRFFLDLSEEETAAALGVRRGTVKSRQSRALARLRTALEETDARP